MFWLWFYFILKKKNYTLKCLWLACERNLKEFLLEYTFDFTIELFFLILIFFNTSRLIF